MKFAKTTLFALASMAATLAAPIAHADIMVNQAASGLFSVDGTKSIALNFNASSRTSGINGASTAQGTFQAVGISGSAAFNISAQVYSFNTTKVVWNGVAYDQIHVLTKPFVYVDMKTGARIDAFAEADLTKSAKGYVCLKVTRLSDNVVISATCDQSGSLMNAPFVSGAIGAAQTFSLPNLPVQ